MSFDAAIPIRFSDLDAFGHVNHARYLTYCEDHRTRMLGAMGDECDSYLLRTGLVVAAVECVYHKPVQLEDGDVMTRCTVVSLGRTSVRLRYELEVQGQCVASVASTLVLIDEHGPRAMTEIEREWLGRYEGSTSY